MSAFRYDTLRLGARRTLGALAVIALLALGSAAVAQAEGPHWQLESRSAPTNLKPGESEAEIRVSAINLGDADAHPPITLTDKLPHGFVATRVSLREGDSVNPTEEGCSLLPNPTCTWTSTAGHGAGPPRERIPPYGRIEVIVTVRVLEGAEAPKPGEATNEVKVEGGDTPSASLSQSLNVSGEPVSFGVEKYELRPENEDGSIDTQAGEHPFQLTTTLAFNQTYVRLAGTEGQHPSLPALAKDLKFDIPPGLLADATAVPQCPTVEFTEAVEAGQGNLNACPANTAVGVASVTFYTPALRFQTKVVPVFNLVPAPGEPARFGFETASVPVFLDTGIRTGENYGAEVSVTHAPTTVELLGSDVTIWGVPGDSRHDNARGWECVDAGFFEGPEGEKHVKPCLPLEQAAPPAFLTLPTTCGVPQETTVSGDAWPTTFKHEGTVKEERFLQASYPMATLNGCEKLQFEPEFNAQPAQHDASTPTGLNVQVNLPQQGILSAGGLAEADVRETTVVLPEGMQANAGAANGLSACTVEESGFSGFNGDTGGTLGGELEAQHFSGGPVACSEDSKIGNVKIKTPLLPNPLEGFVYVASQDTNPFASPLVLYLIAEDPVSGVRIKLAGEVSINQTTGQLVSDFKNTPPDPFEELKLELYDGPRAAQATPASCGRYETQASFVPSSGGKAAQRSSSFTLGAGPSGGACPSGSLPFEPSFQAGTTVNQADAFTPFTLTIGRPDGQQALKSITMHLPPGLAATIASVPQCPEPAAAQGSCGAESLIGHSTAVSGLGGSPVTLGGSVYFAGPYKGAPFSIVDVTPANAGPFHLGNVVVRSTINVDPNTAAATITSDPIPQLVKGVPSQIKELNVVVDRAGFQFNPTNCDPMSVTGTLSGYEGASAAVSSPFQVANCAMLPFHPIFTASTSAHTSKANGANLFVKITYPNGAYANVAKSITELPYALPSRLTTIQKACPDTVFEANPAACDEGSEIGHAIVHTPVFKNPLVGPAYLVSHGNRAFPDIEIVLQGEGITLVLDGHTDIKNSITKTSFESVPDAPVEIFELILPEGPHSALAANDNLCKPEKPGTVTEKVTEHVKGRTIHVTKKVHKMVAEELVIPTKLVAQNGRVLEQRTKIAVSGCGAVKGSKTKKKPAKKAKRSSKKK